MAVLLLSLITLGLVTLCVRSDTARARLRTLSINGDLQGGWRVIAPKAHINQRVGLLNHTALAPQSGLLLKTSRVHMDGMIFSVDIVALDKGGHVLAIVPGAQPDQPLPRFPAQTRFILEIAAGAASALNLKPRDHLLFGDVP